jgi:GntR family transcriptional regulator
VLARRYGHGIISGTQTVEPCLAEADVAELLEVDAGAPAFRFERTSRIEGDRVVEFVNSIYRGDRYRIVVDIFPS